MYMIYNDYHICMSKTRPNENWWCYTAYLIFFFSKTGQLCDKLAQYFQIMIMELEKYIMIQFRCH